MISPSKARLWGAFGTTGQRCTATSRIIVQKGVYQEFVEHFVARAKKIKVGNGLDETVEMGPAVNENQLKTDLKYIEIGKDEGAKLMCGGNRLDKAYLRARLVPRADCIYRSRSQDAHRAGRNLWAGGFDHPVRRARRCHRNRQQHRVRTVVVALHQRREQGVRRVRDLDAGITYINAPTIGAEVHLPFGGTKATGNGHREGGIGAIDFYTEWKSVYVDYSDKLQKAQIDRAE